MKTEKFFGIIAAATLCPLSASAIAFTIIEDSDAHLTGSFQTQFPLSDSKRAFDYETFNFFYWKGSFSFTCQPDMGTYVSFVPKFSVAHTGVGGTIIGDSETFFNSASGSGGSFAFQPYYYYDPRGDTFLVNGSVSYDPASKIVNVGGTFQVTRPNISTVPDAGGTAILMGLAFGSLWLRKSINATAASPSRR